MPLDDLPNGEWLDEDNDIAIEALSKAFNWDMVCLSVCLFGAWLMWPMAGSSFGWYVMCAVMVLGALMTAIGALKAWRQLAKLKKIREQIKSTTARLHSAHWATKEEMRAAGMMPSSPTTEPLAVLPDGTVIFAPPKVINTKIVSPPGTGKTSAALAAQIMHYALDRKISLWIADFKSGELASQCARPLRAAGVDVAVVDDAAATTLEATPVNWLSVVTESIVNTPSRTAMIVRGLALTMLPEPPRDEKNAYWRKSARTIVRYGILHLAHHSPDKCRPGELYRLLSSQRRLDEALAKDRGQDDALGALAEQVFELQDGPNSNFSEHITTARELVEIYETDGILEDAGLGATGFKYADIREKPMVVFLVGSQRDVRVMGKHNALHLRNLLDAMKAPGKVPVRALIDEATNSPVEGLVEDLTTLRGSGGRVVLAYQAESEAERRFGKEAARTIDGVCDMRIIMGVTDQAEAEKLSRLLDKCGLVAFGYNWSDSSRSMSQTPQVHARPLMTPAEILAMPRDELIILINGMPPIRAKKLFQNQIEPFASMFDPNPLEGGKLKPDPIITIKYGAAS